MTDNENRRTRIVTSLNEYLVIVTAAAAERMVDGRPVWSMCGPVNKLEVAPHVAIPRGREPHIAFFDAGNVKTSNFGIATTLENPLL